MSTEENWDPNFYVPFQIFQYVTAAFYYLSSVHAGIDVYFRLKNGSKLTAQQPVLWMLVFFTLAGIVFGTHWITYALSSMWAFEQSYRFFAAYSITGFLGNIGLLFGFLGCQAFTFQIFNLTELSTRLTLASLGRQPKSITLVKKIIIGYLIIIDTFLIVFSIVTVSVPFMNFPTWNSYIIIVRAVFVFSVIPVCGATFLYGYRVVSFMEKNLSSLTSTASRSDETRTNKDAKKVKPEQDMAAPPPTEPLVEEALSVYMHTTRRDLIKEKLEIVVKKLKKANYILNFGIYGYMAIFGFIPSLLLTGFFRQTFLNNFVLIFFRTIMLGWGLLVFVNFMIYYCRSDSSKVSVEMDLTTIPSKISETETGVAEFVSRDGGETRYNGENSSNGSNV